MSEATTSETTGGEAAAAPKKKGKGKLLIIILIALIVLAGGGGGGWYFYKKKADAAEAEHTKEKGGDGDEEDGKAAKKGRKKAKDSDESDESSEENEEGEEHDERSSTEKKKRPVPEPKTVAEAAILSLPSDEEVKQVIELQPYVVNLADADGARYLRLTINVGIGGEEGKEAEEKPNQLFTARVRNAMLAVLTTKTSEEVLTVEGKAKLRKELLRAARKASEEPKVVAIYITEFIVQL